MSGTETGGAVAPDDSGVPSSWNRMWAVFAIAAVWWIALVTLASRTANPVTFNLIQLRTSNVVIAGRIENLETGVVAVSRTWPEDLPLENEVTVSGLNGLNLEAGDSYLMPLTADESGRFEVTPIQMPSSDGGDDQEVRFVYPDSKATRELLETTREQLESKVR